MKNLVLGMMLLAIPAAAQAQTSDDVALCKSSDTEFEVRLAACDAVIGNGEFDGLPWPFERRADTYSDNELYAEAFADFNRSLAIDPNYPAALRSRAVVFNDQGNSEAALADVQRLVEVEPDYYWNHYYNGVVLRDMERNLEAVAAFDKSIALHDDHFFSWWRRSFALAALEDFALAAASMERAGAIEPFDWGVYRQLGRLYTTDEKPDLADRNYRIAITLNPNLGTFDGDQQSEVPPPLPPLRYAAPEPGLQVQFLQVIVPRDTRSEMELAIQEIANWFRTDPKAMPEASAFMTRTMTTSGDAVTMALRVDNQENMEKFIAPGADLPESVETFRGLFLKEIRPRGVNGPIFSIAYDGPDPAGLWPLKIGNEVNGTGRFLLICPDRFQIESMVLGCRIGMESVELGTLQYNLFVEKVETAFVPMGEFVSYVVRYRELGSIKIGGMTDSRETEIRWWISPELNFWVKRTQLQGENIATAIAVEKARN